MLNVGLVVLYAMFLWWFSTGVILYLDRLAPSTYRWSLLAATGLTLPALYGLSATGGGSEGASDAFCAFSCALLVWGWHEMSFLMGHVTGPRVDDCPPDAHGWERFKLAAQTVIYHETAIVLTIAAVAALTWGQVNQVGLLTLVVLWVMRLSTKFNLYLGVPRHHEDMLPDHLMFLKSYFRHRPMNWLFPLSVTGATVLTALLLMKAASPGASALEATGFALVGTLSALALIEHWFLVLPLPDEALWAWAMPKTERRERPSKQPHTVGIDLEFTARGPPSGPPPLRPPKLAAS